MKKATNDNRDLQHVKTRHRSSLSAQPHLVHQHPAAVCQGPLQAGRHRRMWRALQRGRLEYGPLLSHPTLDCLQRSNF